MRRGRGRSLGLRLDGYQLGGEAVLYGLLVFGVQGWGLEAGVMDIQLVAEKVDESGMFI